MKWFRRQNEISDALSRGDLELAIEQFEKRREQPNVDPSELVQLRQRLTNALISRATAAIASENFVSAWNDLSTATEVAISSDMDLVSKQRNQLVELTIESAESMLLSGKAIHATQLINQLRERKIADWRADRIREVADCLHRAETLAAEGKLADSIEQLEAAHHLQPEIQQLPSRIKSKRKRMSELAELTKQLQSSALSCQWIEVNDYCEQILKIAPKHEIAIAAKRHSLQRMKRQTSAGSRNTHVPERVTDSNSFFQIERSTDNSYSAASSSSNPPEPLSSKIEEQAESPLADAHSFLVWVDGVGGYLVCTKPVCTVGQAIEGTTISIPLQADLRKRHARIEIIAGQHLVQPLGYVTLDDVEKESAFVLKDGQVLGLGNGVRLKYAQSHPLSKSSRLDFVSRHRTQPWSDGVILAAKSIILGPNRNNHIFCPRWRSDLIFFQRGDRWFCRRRQPFFVDGQPVENESEIQFDSHITGEDFSLTLEPIFKQGADVHET